MRTRTPPHSGPPAQARRVHFTRDAPSGLVETFDADRPIVLVGRESNASGTAAWRDAVHQIYRAAEGLASHGILLRHLLPDDARELMALARTGAVTETSSATFDGRPFHNSFYVYDRRAAGLLVVVSVGTGTKIDAETLHQPATLRIAEFLGEVQPCLLYSSDVARLGRAQGAFGPITATLQAVGRAFERRSLTGPWVGDDAGRYSDALGIPLQLYTDAVGAEMIKLAGASEREARAIAVRLARAKKARTPRRLVDGRAWWPWEIVPPPGFACAVLADGPPTFRRLGNLLYLDTGDCRPAAEEVAGRLPGVWNADGQPVDQVALVIWFLEHFGRAGYGFVRCATELVARGFSTEALRRRGGPHRAWTWRAPGGTTNTYRIGRSILNNLEVYKTGRWTIHRTDEVAVTVEGMLPPRGFWLTPSRAAEIETYLAELPSIRGGHRGVATFTGHPARVGDTPARLYRITGGDGRIFYRVHRPREAGQERARPIPPIAAEDLAASIAEGLAAASEDLSPLWQATTPQDDRERYLTQLAAKRKQVAELTAAIEARFPQFDRGSPHYAGSAAIRERLAQASEQNSAEREALEHEIGALQTALAAVTVRPDGGFSIDRILDFLGGLQNPEAVAYRDLLRFALGPLQVETVPADPDGGRTEAVRWTATLSLSGPAGTHQVAVAGTSSRTGAAGQRHPRPTAARVVAAVDRLWAGDALPEIDSDWRRLLPGIRAALGVDGVFHLSTVGDRRLRRLGMAVCYPRPGRGRPHRHALCGPPLSDASLRRLADREHEPVTLLRRLQRLYLRPAGKPQWLLGHAPQVAALFAAADDHGGAVNLTACRAAGLPMLWRARECLCTRSAFAEDWDFDDPDHLLLRPCRWCGHPRRMALRLREADGAVCAGCRRDRAGVHWPADPYDAYRFLP